MIFCTIFTSLGSTLIKIGVDRFTDFTLESFLNAYPVLIGLFLYFFGFLLMVFAFKHGELSTLFPFVSLSFVWVTILSFTLLSEAITLLEIIGIGVIVSGVVLIGIASKDEKLRLRG